MPAKSISLYDLEQSGTPLDLHGTKFLFVRDKSDRRSRSDRRQFSYTAHVPERRSGHDRRKSSRREKQSME
jgi:hypothetical protein